MVDYQYYGDASSQQNDPAPDEPLDIDEDEEIILDSIDITVIECADCNRPLLNLLKVSYKDKTARVQIKCINKTCGGISWIHKVRGDYRFSMIKSRDYIHSMEEKDDGLIFITLKKQKEKK
ncbi:hypothetical protein CL634_07665 [bacterium]|nr:hypothetical protein [bacterium]